MVALRPLRRERTTDLFLFTTETGMRAVVGVKADGHAPRRRCWSTVTVYDGKSALEQLHVALLVRVMRTHGGLLDGTDDKGVAIESGSAARRHWCTHVMDMELDDDIDTYYGNRD